MTSTKQRYRVLTNLIGTYKGAIITEDMLHRSSVSAATLVEMGHLEPIAEKPSKPLPERK